MLDKTILIHTIGNRDLQVQNGPDVAIPVSITKLLTDNKEENGYMILKNDRIEEHCFRANSKHLEEHLEYHKESLLKKHLEFPMLRKVLDHVIHRESETNKRKHIDQIRICVTKQADPHIQDTDYVGKICEKFYFPKVKDYVDEIVVEEMNVKPSPDKEKVINVVNDILDRVIADGFKHIYISNKQGLPDVTFAFVFCGLFQSYTYLSITPQGVKEEKNTSYEKLIVKLIERKIV